MFFEDLKLILNWWLVILAFGLLNLPLIFRLFSKFWDKGYIFSKIFSIALTTYFIFVLSSFHIVKFTSFSIAVSALLLGFVNYIFIIKSKERRQIFSDTLKKKWPVFIVQELVFLAILATWSFVRGFAPNIEGLEKFMDWGFVNSVVRAEYLPPLDMWYSGATINYYYFGHLFFGLLTKISGIASTYTYNLSIATVCALTFVSAFSLASNLVFNATLDKKKNYFFIICFGLISAFLLTFGGNLHAAYKIISISLKNNYILNYQSIMQASDKYWYPDATRFVGHDPETHDKTIHEFPLYSFVVSDLHGHMNDIPIVLFFCALLFAFALNKKTLNSFFFVLIGSLILSFAYMTNAWDFAIYGLLFAISSFILDFYHHKSFPKAFSRTVITGILLLIFWFIWSWPFSHNFTPMAEGLRFSDAHTPFYQLFILYGGFWIICFPFLFYIIFRLLLKKPVKLETSDIIVISLVILATFLVILPELIYVKDIYTSDYRRANTMFKLVYEAFILYSISSGYALFRLTKLARSQGGIFIYKILFFVVFVCHMIYPYFAIKSYYSPGRNKYQGLYGLNFLKADLPDSYQTIQWINQNIKGQPVILEASGDSYTLFNHVSMSTGLPTVVGWLVHEWLWRNGYEAPAARQTDVQTIYETADKDVAKQLIDKYKIKYVFVGEKEYEKYSKLDTKKFDDLGAKIIFQSGKTSLYQL